MQVKKIIGLSVIAMGISSMMLPAQAAINTHGITLVNYSYHDSTSRINGGDCSVDLLGPEKGITHARQPGGPPVRNDIDSGTVWFACFDNLENCTAEVYMNDHCNGPSIATVVVNTNDNGGVKSVNMHSDDYSISYSGFTISLAQKVDPVKK